MLLKSKLCKPNNSRGVLQWHPNGYYISRTFIITFENIIKFNWAKKNYYKYLYK